MSTKKNIIYFIDKVEQSFVINDIQQLSTRFDNLILFSVNEIPSGIELPKNVIVFEEYLNWNEFQPKKIVFKNILALTSIYINECIAVRCILPIKKSLATIASNIIKANSILEKLSENKIDFSNSIFYSFWFYDCIFLAWLKKMGVVKTAITRAHGGDIYEERGSLKLDVLFRNFQLNYLDSVYSVSEAGSNYLINKYPLFKHKIKTSYLGSRTYSINPFSSETFTLVSCANFRHQKRIHKIAEVLMHINFSIHWIHFGDENLNSKDPKIEEYKKNKELIKSNTNIKFSPKGFLENKEMLEFYSKHTVNLFISLSAFEGVPVTMMEAISFGIPVLSTDVGGCKEIVNNQTGILIPLETSTKKVAEIITDFKDSEKNTVEFRKGVRKFWEDNFEVEKNYNTFFEEIVSLEELMKS